MVKKRLLGGQMFTNVLRGLLLNVDQAHRHGCRLSKVGASVTIKCGPCGLAKTAIGTEMVKVCGTGS
jgi:hypothetical protein